MEYIIYTILGIIIISLYFYYKRKIQQTQQKFDTIIKTLQQRNIDELTEKEKREIEARVQCQIEELQEQKQRIESIIQSKTEYIENLLEQLQSIKQILKEQQEQAKIYESELRKNVQENVKIYEQDLLKNIQQNLTNKQIEMQQMAELNHKEIMAILEAQEQEAHEKIIQLEQQIEEYKKKQNAINKAIMHRRAVEEQQDFYRVCINEDSLSDISFLQETRKNLKKPEFIDKIIYDNYIAKPVLEMIKRVLQNTTCSGIYKITCLKTGEIYIGKSTDIKNRWQQHCKAVFNCGTIASSLLHTKMKQHGIENFTFELVEQVPKDQLSEREKFYISFYQSKEVGLNERQG